MKNFKILCKGCSKSFVPKHGNRIFHNDRCCDDHHNLLAKKRRDAIKEVRKPLEKNYKILKSILGDNEFVYKSSDFLEGAGFNIRYNTGELLTPDKKCMYNFYGRIGLIKEEYYYKIVKL